MDKTDKYEFDLIGINDPVSPAPINRNTQRMEEELLKAEKARNGAYRQIASAIGGRVRMAAGSYIGNGALSVQINVGEFTPKVIFMRSPTFSNSGDKESALNYLGIPSIHAAVGGINGDILNEKEVYVSGWLLWIGQDIKTTVYSEMKYESADMSGKPGSYARPIGRDEISTEIKFSSGQNHFRWELGENGGADLKTLFSALVNNYPGMTYEWVAFGEAEVTITEEAGEGS